MGKGLSKAGMEPCFLSLLLLLLLFYIQKFNQKFMSQVKYRRSKEYEEKFEKEEELKKKEEEEKSGKKGASHIDRIREYKMLRIRTERKLPLGAGSSSIGSVSTVSSSRSPRTYRRGSRTGGIGSGRRGSGNNNADDDDIEEIDRKPDSSHHGQRRTVGFSVSNQNNGSSPSSPHNSGENRVPLASTQRIIKVIREVVANTREDGTGLSPMNRLGGGTGGTKNGKKNDKKQETIEEIVFLNANIECFLINRDYLVVNVTCYMGEDTLETEAEISSSELASFMEGGDTEAIKSASLNLTFLSEVAQEIVDNVEAKVDISHEIRLILNLFSDSAGSEGDPHGDVNMWNMSMMNSSILSNNEELQSILLAGKSI
jgi:hypothetical protein